MKIKINGKEVFQAKLWEIIFSVIFIAILIKLYIWIVTL